MTHGQRVTRSAAGRTHDPWILVFARRGGGAYSALITRAREKKMLRLPRNRDILFSLLLVLDLAPTGCSSPTDPKPVPPQNAYALRIEPYSAVFLPDSTHAVVAERSWLLYWRIERPAE